MLVYGDPSFVMDCHSLRSRLEQRLHTVNVNSIDDLRALLIQTGQFEQAMADMCEGEFTQEIQSLTDLAAKLFYAAWSELDSRLPPSPFTKAEALGQLRCQISRMTPIEASLTVKIPEGFAFYALFPEQYGLTALRWARLQQNLSTRVLVVGVRSIGTTLSALVKVVLEVVGWNVERLTLRPAGKPFSRTVQLPGGLTSKATDALIVDEGPGLSGSTMESTAQALVSAGFAPGRIAFFPGHENGPGSAASEASVSCWNSVSQVYTPLSAVCWGGLSLTQTLGSATPPSGSRHIEALPSTGSPFERIKFLSSNNAQPVLWKFVGLGAWHDERFDSMQKAISKMEVRADLGWSPHSLGTSHGFIALPWIEGQPLQPSDFDSLGVTPMASYISKMAGPALSPEEHMDSMDRLQKVIYWNTMESLGGDDARLAQRSIANLSFASSDPCFGDGDMSPDHWLRTGSGVILKVGGGVHDADHTFVGRQSLLWDIAGAVTEWDLPPSTALDLAIAARASSVVSEKRVMHLYLLAYAAFRAGQTDLCAPSASAVRHMSRGSEFYRTRLKFYIRSQS